MPRERFLKQSLGSLYSQIKQVRQTQKERALPVDNNADHSSSRASW